MKTLTLSDFIKWLETLPVQEVIVNSVFEGPLYDWLVYQGYTDPWIGTYTTSIKVEGSQSREVIRHLPWIKQVLTIEQDTWVGEEVVPKSKYIQILQTELVVT